MKMNNTNLIDQLMTMAKKGKGKISPFISFNLENFELNKGSLLHFLRENRYIPKYFLPFQRNRYSCFFVDTYLNERAEGCYFTIMSYNSLKIIMSVKCDFKKDCFSVDDILITDKVDLTLGYKASRSRALEILLYFVLNNIEVSLDIETTIKANYLQYGDEGYRDDIKLLYNDLSAPSSRRIILGGAS